MKLIPLVVALLCVLKAESQNVNHEPFPFPPQYQKPNKGVFSSDSTLYLPPESHTALPYFPLKNVKLPFQYLPPTGTKAPMLYQTPFPMLMSSSMIPNFEDDDDDQDNIKHNQNRLSSPQPPNFNNRSENAPPPNPQQQHQQHGNQRPQETQNREMRAIPKTVQYRHPIDRADIKYPLNVGPMPQNLNPANRRMIISAETRSDLVQDQVKTASFQGPHFIPPPIGFVSSTTEPAIPILRLSNEMDLDGSYSYEALGADQTHYVQHSRMENMGTDKEEQVVEGSYSYVGDNGQTYTVHYVADANGFRASGDHLPVGPPVPEIIQRAVNYNLAEEAKRPAHLKAWQDDENENFYEKDKNYQNHFVLPAQQPPPPRNLFTGRTPEAFSFSYTNRNPSQEQLNAENNLAVAASNQAPVKTVDFKQEQQQQSPAKSNNGPISPQITFLASQGAHLPSVNNPQPSISRMFTSEKPGMPQLMNYEASMKEKEKEQDNNKGLWRWQYGINANQEAPAKNTISRSFSEGDDVMINFGDMTPEDYTRMIRSQLDTNGNGNTLDSTYFSQQGQQERQQNFHEQQYQQYSFAQNPQISSSTHQTFPMPTPENYQNYQQTNEHNQNMFINQQQRQKEPEPTPQPVEYTTQQHYTTQQQVQQTTQTQKIQAKQQDQPQQYNQQQYEQQQQNQYEQQQQKQYEEQQKQYEDQQKQYEEKQKQYEEQENKYNQQIQTENQKSPHSRNLNPENSHPNIITIQHFVPPSQTVTQSYDYDEEYYEPLKVGKSYNLDTLKIVPSDPPVMPQNNIDQTFRKYQEGVENYSQQTIRNSNEYEIKLTTTEAVAPTIQPSPTTVKTSLKFTDFIVKDSESDFKPIVTVRKLEENPTSTTTEESIKDMLESNIFLKNLFNSDKTDNKGQNAIIKEPKQSVANKVIAEPKSDKSPKIIHSKAYINELKGQKKKPLDISLIMNYASQKNQFESSKMKPKSKSFPENYSHRKEYYNEDEKDVEIRRPESIQHQHSLLNQKQQEELRGVIKNYKVLQRNNNMNDLNNHNHNPIRKDQNPLRMLQIQTSNLPPLGRAGPTVKSYLPPIYV